MLLNELLDLKPQKKEIPELDTEKLIKNLNDAKIKQLGNCGPREHVCTVIISENQFDTDEKKHKMELMVQDFNKTITAAMFQELSNQIKKSDDVEAKNFIFRAENPDYIPNLKHKKK